MFTYITQGFLVIRLCRVFIVFAEYASRLVFLRQPCFGCATLFAAISPRAMATNEGYGKKNAPRIS